MKKNILLGLFLFLLVLPMVTAQFSFYNSTLTATSSNTSLYFDVQTNLSSWFLNDTRIILYNANWSSAEGACVNKNESFTTINSLINMSNVSCTDEEPVVPPEEESPAVVSTCSNSQNSAILWIIFPIIILSLVMLFTEGFGSGFSSKTIIYLFVGGSIAVIFLPIILDIIRGIC